MLNPAAAARRAIPSLDRLLQLEVIAELTARYGRSLVTEAARAELASLRATLGRRPGNPHAGFDEARFVGACAERLARATRPSLRPVFNLTGTVLHTNLGRALMPQEAAQAVARAMTRPVNLVELDEGDRGERDRHASAGSRA
jgi:L-seryl-tRNA(Ser) seleniumtransferase